MGPCSSVVNNVINNCWQSEKVGRWGPIILVRSPLSLGTRVPTHTERMSVAKLTLISRVQGVIKPLFVPYRDGRQAGSVYSPPEVSRNNKLQQTTWFIG